MPERAKAIEKKRLVHLAPNAFSLRSAKMTVGVLRYGYHEPVAVIDPEQAGKTAEEVVGCGGDTPVVATLEETLKFGPEAVLVGIAPAGGRLPADMKETLLRAIEHGLDVYAGLHDFLEDDPDISAAAAQRGVRLWDIRKPPGGLPVGGARCRNAKSYIALMVGSDCAIGKMTAALEIDRAAHRKGIKTEFIATGQCGIAIAGWGSPVDAIPGDFMAGCVERDVLSADGDAEIILVEGQGALLHPGYSAVTLGLLHGACPDGLILNHMVTRKTVTSNPDIRIPALAEVVRLYQELAAPMKPTALVGTALNTFGLSESEARRAVSEAEDSLGVPATDPVRYGAEKLVEALQQHRREVGKHTSDAAEATASGT